MESIRDEQGRVMISRVRKFIKSLGFRIEGDAVYGYKLEIGEPDKRVSKEPIDWDRAGVDPTYVMPETVLIEGTLREYKLTKEELIRAAEKYLSVTAGAVG